MPDWLADPQKRRYVEAKQRPTKALRTAIAQIRFGIRYRDFRAYLDAWRDYARLLLDAYAHKRIRTLASRSAHELGAALAREIPDIVDGILPERNPRMEVEASLLPASYVAIGKYRYDGEWEEFMPQEVGALESPDDRKEVRAALTQTLEERAAQWIGQFHEQSAASGSVPSEPPTKPPPPAPHAKGRTRGPSPDHETAERVAAIVSHFGSQWSRGEMLDNVLQALDEGDDEGKIPTPMPWKSRGIDDWTDAGIDNRDLARKAIQHHLELAARSRGIEWLDRLYLCRNHWAKVHVGVAKFGSFTPASYRGRHGMYPSA
jgi:hypothetical protein